MTRNYPHQAKAAAAGLALIIILVLVSPAAWAAGGAMPSLVHDIGISLLAAGTLGVIFTRLKIPSIAAFLLAGILIGPIGLKQVTDPENIDTIAQLGFILLLFLIGLEIDFKKILGSGKAIIIINPAEPPLMMRDTVHCLTVDEPDQAAITQSVHDMIAEVQKYVPGYTLKNGPVFDGNRVSIYMEVEGLGDFLPKYAGNLDIMTAAGLRTAEMYAEEILAGNFVPNQGS